MLPACMGARYSCESGLIEVLIEDPEETRAIDSLEPWDRTNDGNTSVVLYRFAVIVILPSDHHDTCQRYTCITDGRDSQKRVIDCAQCGSGSNDGGSLEVAYEINHKCVLIDGDQHATRTLNDNRC